MVEAHSSPVGLAVLALLAEGPLHPYRMQGLIKERAMDDVVNVRNRSGLYAAITRLTKEGLIRAGETEQDGPRPRTLYELTSRGRTLLQESLRDCLATPVAEFPLFPAVVSFLHLVEPLEALRCLEKRADALCQSRDRTGVEMAGATERGVPRLHLLEREHMLAVIEAELNWVRGVTEDITTRRLWWTRL